MPGPSHDPADAREGDYAMPVLTRLAEDSRYRDQTSAESAFERVSRDQGTFADRAAVRAALTRLATYDKAYDDLTKALGG